ncbi:MAG: hypothetical protein ACLPOO_10890, partial [Terriglobales bacterium]
VCFEEAKWPGEIAREKSKTRSAAKNERSKSRANKISDFFRRLYSRSPRTIERMIENMFIGRPPGNYDRLLDFSRAVTGNLFFVPSATFLENVTEDQTQPAIAESPAAPAGVEPSPSIPSSSDRSVREGSLGIGSLKGDVPHE